jgi:hypothetical protein
MRLVASILVVLLASRCAWAEEPVLAAPARQRVHTEKVGAVALAGTSLVLTMVGGMLIGEHNGSDGMLDSGIAITAVGGSLIIPTLTLGLYAAGHDAGLATPGALIDTEAAKARTEERVGITLFFTGLALFAGGFGMAMAGLGNPSFGENGGGSSGNAGLFASGCAFSVLGDALWFSGMLVWPHAGGKRRGIREARAALGLTGSPGN